MQLIAMQSLVGEPSYTSLKKTRSLKNMLKQEWIKLSVEHTFANKNFKNINLLYIFLTT